MACQLLLHITILAAAMVYVSGLDCYHCESTTNYACHDDGLNLGSVPKRSGCAACGKSVATITGLPPTMNRTCHQECFPTTLHQDRYLFVLDFEEVCCTDNLCNSATQRVPSQLLTPLASVSLVMALHQL